MVLLCNEVSHWLGASLESALYYLPFLGEYSDHKLIHLAEGQWFGLCFLLVWKPVEQTVANDFGHCNHGNDKIILYRIGDKVQYHLHNLQKKN